MARDPYQRACVDGIAAQQSCPPNRGSLRMVLLVLCLVIVTACTDAATTTTEAPTETAPTTTTTEAPTETAPTTTTTEAPTETELNVTELGDAFGDFLASSPVSPPDRVVEAFSSETWPCVGRSFAEGLVDSVGDESLISAGVTPQRVREGTAGLGEVVTNSEFDVLLLGAFEACFDVVELLARDDGSEEAELFRCVLGELLADEKGRAAVASAWFTVGDLSAIADILGSAYLDPLVEPCFEA
jgi:hypothetical protein